VGGIVSLALSRQLLEEIHRHGEAAYPEEGAGFLLGTDGAARTVEQILPIVNARETTARANRYLISAEEYLRVEQVAETRRLDVLGVFHSHPDHASQPSEFDREWAQPQFSYLITAVSTGGAQGSRSWRLREDRTGFEEEELRVE
jgi:proteasome lid subunit RPN8/RPN11